MCSPRCWSGVGWPPTSSRAPGTCSTTSDSGAATGMRYHRKSPTRRLPQISSQPSTDSSTPTVRSPPALTSYYETLFPKAEGDSGFVYRSTIRARVCDDLRGLLPAATISNVGIHASGQAFEMLLLRMRAHPLAEVRAYADLMLTELRKVAPAFLRRVDLPDRGGDWSRYLEETAAAVSGIAVEFEDAVPDRPEVTLVEWDPDAELKVAAAALYSVTDLPDDVLLARVRALPEAERRRLITAYVGDRRNRRHKPGRALSAPGIGLTSSATTESFATSNVTAFSRSSGSDSAPCTATEFLLRSRRSERAVAGGRQSTALPTYPRDFHPAWDQTLRSMRFRSRSEFASSCSSTLALRSTSWSCELPSAVTPDYRRVCQEMHRLIREQAGHAVIADAMRFVDHSGSTLGRLDSERKAEARRGAAGITPAG